MKKVMIALLVALSLSSSFALAATPKVTTHLSDGWLYCYWIGGEMFCDWIDG